MPFIHIKSLAFEKAFDVQSVVEALTLDFSKGTGIGPEHITATWTFLSPGHYAVGGKAAQYQPAESHPVLVELLAPDFNTAETVEKMLMTVASSLSRHTEIPRKNIFIVYRQAHSGMVFDAGEIVRW
jgi:phenylpyruvate tautomerase PptA (4-oxalocrotonate tautomerase family)